MDDIKRYADFLEFIDLAFPGACSVTLNKDNRMSFTVTITNILRGSIDKLIIPKLNELEISRYKYDQEDEEAVFLLEFDPASWREALPFAFLDFNLTEKQFTVENISAILRALYRKDIDAKEYQIWITEKILKEPE